MLRARFMLLVPLALALGCGGNTNTTPTGNPPGGANPPGGNTPPPAVTPAPTTVAFTLTAEALYAEYKKDGAAFKTKYAGKWVELSGEVNGPRMGFGGADLLLWGKKPEKPGDFKIGFVSVTPSKAEAGKYEGLKALAKGQLVTVRGEVQAYGGLTKCEFAKVGPSTALPVTAAGLLAALSEDATKGKYEDKEVVLRGVVRKAEWNGTIARLDVADVGVKDGPLLEASLNPQAKEVGIELAKLPVGSVVILIGEAQTANDGRIWDFRVLTAPPEGVALPDAKK